MNILKNQKMLETLNKDVTKKLVIDKRVYLAN